MEPNIIQVLPPTGKPCALHGLYLNERLHTRGGPGAPYVYSNYVASLDGRIALPSETHQTHQVPQAIANGRDWRLYQELAAQADILITSARYFRQSAQGEQQDLLPVGAGEDFADLRHWRLEQGLRPQPDVVVLSSSLDIPVKTLRNYSARRVFLATGAGNDQNKAQTLATEAGAQLLQAGQGRHVEGAALVDLLGDLGYRSLYAIAGPSVFYTLISSGVLQRLYLTQAHRLLGGTEFDTLNWGPALTPAVHMEPVAMYLDRDAAHVGSQLFCTYDCQYR